MSETIARSSTLGDLAAALVKAQGEVKGAIKDSTNPFFKSTYADLASVWEACRHALTANGLSVVQLPGFEDGNPGTVTLTTILLHSSGEWIQGTAGAPLKTPDAQGVGSAITYLRRYALAAIAGVVQEDDDGEKAVDRKPTPATAKPGVHSSPIAASGPGAAWKGKPLGDFQTEELTKLRAWCVRTNPEKFATTIEQIDDVLSGRAGE